MKHSLYHSDISTHSHENLLEKFSTGFNKEEVERLDVALRFAEEARRMHYGETEVRGIRGRTTPEEAQALDEEGIEVYSLPMPELLKGPAH